MKMGTVQTRLTYFLSTSGRINLHDDSFQKWKPLQACKKFSNVSKNTRKVVLSIRDNMQCKEGIFSDILGEKLRRHKEK